MFCPFVLLISAATLCNTYYITFVIINHFVFRINKSKGNGKSRVPSKYQDEIEQDEGLALLIPDIQETANLVQVGVSETICSFV
jgi:hypothetical protein